MTKFEAEEQILLKEVQLKRDMFNCRNQLYSDPNKVNLVRSNVLCDKHVFTDLDVDNNKKEDKNDVKIILICKDKYHKKTIDSLKLEEF